VLLQPYKISVPKRTRNRSPPRSSRARSFSGRGVTAAACDPSEASNQFREIPFTSSGDAPQNVQYYYPFQLGPEMYSTPEIVTIRNITAFVLRHLLIAKDLLAPTFRFYS
jgi:hypothetical protein